MLKGFRNTLDSTAYDLEIGRNAGRQLNSYDYVNNIGPGLVIPTTLRVRRAAPP